MTLTQEMKETPMAPYIGILDSMTGRQKLTVISYLRYSLKSDSEEGRPQEASVAEKSSRVMLKPNPFKHFKHSEDITDEDRAFMRRKLNEMPHDTAVENMLDGLTLSREELQDERTRYILGIGR